MNNNMYYITTTDGDMFVYVNQYGHFLFPEIEKRTEMSKTEAEKLLSELNKDGTKFEIKYFQSESQKKAQAKYRKKLNHVDVTFFPTESELWSQLEKQTNKSGYIKSLILQDMRKDGG